MMNFGNAHHEIAKKNVDAEGIVKALRNRPLSGMPKYVIETDESASSAAEGDIPPKETVLQGRKMKYYQFGENKAGTKKRVDDIEGDQSTSSMLDTEAEQIKRDKLRKKRLQRGRAADDGLKGDIKKSCTTNKRLIVEADGITGRPASRKFKTDEEVAAERVGKPRSKFINTQKVKPISNKTIKSIEAALEYQLNIAKKKNLKQALDDDDLQLTRSLSGKKKTKLRPSGEATNKPGSSGSKTKGNYRQAPRQLDDKRFRKTMNVIGANLLKKGPSIEVIFKSLVNRLEDRWNKEDEQKVSSKPSTPTDEKLNPKITGKPPRTPKTPDKPRTPTESRPKTRQVQLTEASSNKSRPRTPMDKHFRPNIVRKPETPKKSSQNAKTPTEAKVKVHHVHLLETAVEKMNAKILTKPRTPSHLQIAEATSERLYQNAKILDKPSTPPEDSLKPVKTPPEVLDDKPSTPPEEKIKSPKRKQPPEVTAEETQVKTISKPEGSVKLKNIHILETIIEKLRKDVKLLERPFTPVKNNEPTKSSATPVEAKVAESKSIVEPKVEPADKPIVSMNVVESEESTDDTRVHKTSSSASDITIVPKHPSQEDLNLEIDEVCLDLPEETPPQPTEASDCEEKQEQEETETTAASLSNLDLSAALNSNSEMAEIKYGQKAQRTLIALNNQVSSALRDGLSNINDIWFKVRQTVDQINEFDRQYQELKRQQTHRFESQSTPQILDANQNEVEPNNMSLMHALSLGLVQTQSENQVRLAVTPARPETPAKQEDAILKIPPLATPEPPPPPVPPKLNNPPILPKLVPFFEPVNPPCATLKQQKMDVFNIPPRISPDEDGARQNARKEAATRAAKPLKESPTDLKQQLKELAAKFGCDELPRSKAQQDLHTRLIKEVEATDSLLEFQRQMKHVKEAQVGDAKPAIAAEVKEASQPSAAKVEKKSQCQITAEELFVPEKKINKIAATNLKPSPSLKLRPKTCQYLYREKKKKEHKKSREVNDKASSNTIRVTAKNQKVTKETPAANSAHHKYADSLWFCSNSKKVVKNNNESSPSSSSPMAKSTAVVDCTSKEQDLVVDDKVQSHTDLQNYFWPRNSVQPVNYKTGLDCFDILDEISLKDIKPLESEYPRKDHIYNALHKTRVEDTFLYKLVYGLKQNEFLNLLRVEEPMLHCSTPTCRKCFRENIQKKGNEAEKKHKHPSNDALLTSSELDKHSTRSNSAKSNKRRNKSPTDNNVKKWKSSASDEKWSAPKSSDIKKHHSSSSSKQQHNEKQRSKSTKVKKDAQEDVITKLRPYIFDPQMRYPTTITVMPVSLTTTYANPNFNQSIPTKCPGGDFQQRVKSKSELKGKNRCAHKLVPKKLMGNKYQKTPSMNLMTYLEKQNLLNPQPIFRGTSEESLYEESKQATLKGRRKNIYTIQDAINQMGPATPRMPQPQPIHLQTHVAKAHPQQVLAPPPIQPSRKTPAAPAKNAPKAGAKHPPQPRPAARKQAVKNAPEKTSLESTIQGVIEKIEDKIVDIVSSPEKMQSNAFDSIEQQIVDILWTMQKELKPLDAIQESDASEAKSESELEEKAKKVEKVKKVENARPKTTGMPAKKAKPIKKDRLSCSGTDPSIVDPSKIELTVSDDVTSPSVISQGESTNEEHFEITSSCAPPPSKPQETNIPPVQGIKLHEKPEKLEKNKNLEEAKKDTKLSKKVVTTSNKKENLQVIRSDEFLTPFMRTLKQFRQEDRKVSSCNILEFLDTLARISEQTSSPMLPPVKKFSRSTINFKYTICVAYAFQEPAAFYPIASYQPVTIQPICDKKPLPAFSECSKITTRLSEASVLIPTINLGKFMGFENYLPKSMSSTQPKGREMVCYRVNNFLPDLNDNPIRAWTKKVQKEIAQSSKLPLSMNAISMPVNKDHGLLLNSVYGMLFTVIFLGLTFNYSCQ